MPDKKAFTLAEVLITLVIIGVVAAITVPVMMNNAKWAEYKSGAFKAKSVLDNALRMYHVKEGEIPQCSYWEKNPYGNTKCVEYNTEGICTKSVLASDGSTPPEDYNGKESDCSKVYEFLVKNLNVAKYCSEKAFENGCIPHYNGIDDIYKNNNPDDTDADVNANKYTAGLGYWKTTNIEKGSAIVTTDGMIFLPLGPSPKLFLVDVNGQKGPNKFGHDVVSFIAVIRNQHDVPKYSAYSDNRVKDKGGKGTKELMYKD